MLQRLKSHVVLASIAAASCLAHAGPTAGVYPDRIVLGQSAKLSGTGGTQLGRQYRDGLLLAFDSANRAGGVNGRRIELMTLDDQINDAKALANTRALIEQHHVFAMVGNTFSSQVRAVLPLMRETGVPLVAPYANIHELYDGSQPQVFTLRASIDDEIATIVRHIDTVGYDQIAYIHYSNAFGEEMRANIDRQLSATGRRFIASVSMPINPSNSDEAVRPAVKLLTARCPKAIVLGVSGKDAVALVRAMSPCQGVRYLARGVIDVSILVRELGEQARGIMVTQVVPNPNRSTHPLVRDYRDSIRQKNPKAHPDFTEFEGFIAGRFIVQALRRSGRELDRAGFVRALETQTLDGPDHYRLAFTPGKHVASRYVNIVMISEGGRIAD